MIDRLIGLFYLKPALMFFFEKIPPGTLGWKEPKGSLQSKRDQKPFFGTIFVQTTVFGLGKHSADDSVRTSKIQTVSDVLYKILRKVVAEAEDQT